MNVQLRKIGNSTGIILPKELLDRLGLKAGDNVELAEEDNRVWFQGTDRDFAEDMKLAEVFMDRYKVALKKLAE